MKTPHATFPSCCEDLEFKLTAEPMITPDSINHKTAKVAQLLYFPHRTLMNVICTHDIDDDADAMDK